MARADRSFSSSPTSCGTGLFFAPRSAATRNISPEPSPDLAKLRAQVEQFAATRVPSSLPPAAARRNRALVFAAMLALIAAAYFFTEISHTLLFWMAFILTRPLGATFGDLLTKPYANGCLNLNRINSSLVIAALIVGCILLMPQRGGYHPRKA